SGAMSMAMTHAPISTASCVADRPTGPWPKMAIVSPPCSWTRRSAPQAVPVPQEMAAPVMKESGAGSGTSVDTGTQLNLSRRQKIILQNVFHTKAIPFIGQNHFWTGFCQRGHD